MPIMLAPFINEEQRQEFYQKKGLEVPPFSTLNSDVIPQPELLEQVDVHQAKFDPDLIKELWKTIGLQTSDERVLKTASALLEMQMLKIIQELKSVAPMASL